jgi:serine phosphatase RsbU (regulator of sigma subunit)
VLDPVIPSGAHSVRGQTRAMGLRFPVPTPSELIEALHTQGPSARLILWKHLRPTLERLIDRLIAQHRLTAQRDRLVVHSLHTAETWLRTRPAQEFAHIAWPAFLAAVMFQIGKLVALPFGRQTTATAQRSSSPSPLPESSFYQSQTVFLPYERIGNTWFGGDWFGGQQASDGSLWILLTDITGHGYFAYLLASTMPSVWQKCWPLAANNHCEPADLLAAMHQLFEECFPEGIYVEGTLVRLDRDGTVTVAPAGGTRLLLHRSGAAKSDQITIRGSWLGLAAPHPRDQHTWRLEPGDELVLATDGLFDQLADHPGDEPGAWLQTSGNGVFEQVKEQLHEALRQQSQKDDITVVALRRLAPKSGQEG